MKEKVVVVIEDGVVTNVLTTNEHINVQIIDMDKDYLTQSKKQEIYKELFSTPTLHEQEYSITPTIEN